ncbi:hypothetical protein FIBSPDRAFT_901226 [Athelia psychrophila]|uniref:Uncharacterized protein n=1 Tax=Athelia psychrophila TaxID=1759441 RepID=A0A165XFP3_9AGAM|nr:hypothetical protein FIBSPDRAFT_901226 [Fibularhizoctonia sp. CBS 109695]
MVRWGNVCVAGSLCAGIRVVVSAKGQWSVSASSGKRGQGRAFAKKDRGRTRQKHKKAVRGEGEMESRARRNRTRNNKKQHHEEEGYSRSSYARESWIPGGRGAQARCSTPSRIRLDDIAFDAKAADHPSRYCPNPKACAAMAQRVRGTTRERGRGCDDVFAALGWAGDLDGSKGARAWECYT